MKKLLLLATVIGATAAMAPRASAGFSFGISIGHSYSPPVYVAPPPVYVAPPVCAPAPPVCVAPAPVVIGRPVYVAPPPVVYYGYQRPHWRQHSHYNGYNRYDRHDRGYRRY